jgi:hypothetical protein
LLAKNRSSALVVRKIFFGNTFRENDRVGVPERCCRVSLNPFNIKHFRVPGINEQHERFLEPRDISFFVLHSEKTAHGTTYLRDKRKLRKVIPERFG